VVVDDVVYSVLLLPPVAGSEFDFLVLIRGPGDQEYANGLLARACSLLCFPLSLFCKNNTDNRKQKKTRPRSGLDQR
jgi:hypothetical protein